MNPLEGNTFRTRADAQRAVGALFEPLFPHTGGAALACHSARLPFWSAAESEAARERRRVVQRPAVAVIVRDRGQAQMLDGGRGHWIVRQGAAKYGKLVYSSAFAFGLDPDDPAFADTGDAMLVVRDVATGARRVRTSVVESGVDGDVVWSRWQPYPDVEIVTVRSSEMPWHARRHHVRTGRALETFEGGFAIGAVDDPVGAHTAREASGHAPVAQRVTTSGLYGPSDGLDVSCHWDARTRRPSQIGVASMSANGEDAAIVRGDTPPAEPKGEGGHWVTARIDRRRYRTDIEARGHGRA